MTVPFLVRGDALPESPLPGDATTDADARGLCWNVDLTGCATRSQARAAKRAALAALKAELDAHPRVVRVCVVCTRPEQFPRNVLVRIPQSLAEQLHNDLERDRGAFIGVTVLDVTGCDDRGLLRARISEACSASATWADLFANWDAINEDALCEIWIAQRL